MCMEEQNQQKRSSKSGHPNDRDWSNPRNAQSPHARNIFRVEAENNQESFDPKDIPQEPPNPPPQSGERDFGPNHQDGRGGDRERGHGRGRNQQGEKRSGSAFSTRRTMTTTQITTPIKKGFEAILEEEKKQKERVVPINHTAPAWQNAPMAEAISPILYNNLHFPRPPQTFSQPPSWQSQTFQAQNVEQKPPEHFPPTPPPPPYKGPTAPPLPPKAEGQSNPLPSVGTILPIWGDLP